MFSEMPNQRHPDQKLLPFTAKGQFIEELDAGLRQLNISNRSSFIRQAITEKLARMNIHIREDLVAAPDRIGKGGPKPRAGAKASSKLKLAEAKIVEAVRRKYGKGGTSGVAE